MSLRFALFGAAGFVAPRHLAAIRDVGGALVAACDPHDSVGVLDAYFPAAEFFTGECAMVRHLRDVGVDYVSICSPNDRHVGHIQRAAALGAKVICEKPLVTDPAHLSRIRGDVNCIMQLRHLEQVKRLAEPRAGRASVEVVYVTRRGRWYGSSWKADDARSGGLVYNIGIHLLDLLVYSFGGPRGVEVSEQSERSASGTLDLERADVTWRLSINESDLPDGHPTHAYRRLLVDGEEIDLSSASGSLHTAAYREIVAGRGWGIEDVRPAIELADMIRQAGR